MYRRAHGTHGYTHACLSPRSNDRACHGTTTSSQEYASSTTEISRTKRWVCPQIFSHCPHANASPTQAFLESSDVAHFFGLSPVEAIHMPLPLSIVFVGFSGDGNFGVEYSADTLQQWFGHLDHLLPHSRIELADLSCAEDGERERSISGREEPIEGP